MFKITIGDCETFKKQIRVISSLISEGKVKVNKNSFGITAIDPSNVVLVDYEVFSSACIEYAVSKEDEFAINFNTFNQMLKTALPSSLITLSKNSIDDKLVLEIKGETDRTFKLPIIDFDEKDAKMSKLMHTCEMDVNSSMLKNEIDASSLVGDSVLFITKGSRFIVKAEGDLSEVTSEFRDISIKSETEEEIKSKYSIEYLKKIAEAGIFCSEVKISYAEDCPAEFVFRQDDKFKMNFIIAPRVEE